MKECLVCGKCLEDNLTECPDDGSSLVESIQGSGLIDGKYLLERCLGRGAMGSVYQARHKELEKTFALKLIQYSGRLDSTLISRFRIEAKALGRLRHPNIVQVTDFGVDSRRGGMPYLVMEHLEGITLYSFLQDKKFLTVDEAIPILEAISSAIDFAHEYGILHRDLKLKNVFMVRDLSGSYHVKILDFGLARILAEPELKKIGSDSLSHVSLLSSDQPQEKDETQTLVVAGKKSLYQVGPDEQLWKQDLKGKTGQLTQPGSIMGTPGYIAPELFEGREATTASDIFSFGVLAYEILAGNSPFKNTSLQKIPMYIRGIPLPLSSKRPDIPVGLDQVVLGPLDKNPDKRPEKAGEVVKQLKNAHTAHQYRTWRTQQVPKRLRMAGVLTLALMLLYWFLPGLTIVKSFENYLVDLRFRLLSVHPPHNSILLVSTDEASLKEDSRLLTEPDEMSLQLQRILEARVSGLALDFVLPERWGESERFAKMVLNNQGRVVLASYIKKDGSYMGWECISGLIMAALGSKEKAESLFGFINMNPDPDGCMRRTQVVLRDREGKRILSMPARSFEILSGKKLSDKHFEKPLLIDFSIDWTRFERIFWKDLSLYLEERPDMFVNRMVLVGGEYAGSQDIHRIPHRRGSDEYEVSGLVLNALTLNSLLRGRLFIEAHGSTVSLFLAVCLMFFSTVSLIRSKVFPCFIILIFIFFVYILWAGLLFKGSSLLLPVAAPVVILIFFIAVVLLVRRRLIFMKKPVKEVLVQ
jgi:serine/threonine protein kinase